MSFGFACILQGCKHQCSHVPNLDGFHSIYIIQMAVRFQEEETLFFPIVRRQLGMLVTPRKNLSNEKKPTSVLHPTIPGSYKSPVEHIGTLLST